MDTLKAVNTLNAVNLGLGGPMNGHSKCSEHSEYSEFCEFGTWWSYEWML